MSNTLKMGLKLLLITALATFALANMMQFTTIRGINNPKASNKSGTKASISIPTMVTKAAIITTKAGILILSGMKFLNSDMTRLDAIRTKVTANPIPTPFIAAVVTASVGHIPNTSRKIGFSFIIPFKITSFIFIGCPLLTQVQSENNQ
jgi:hypothetical protein